MNRKRTTLGSEAFTLIEMMVVIVIILILSGIVLRVGSLAGRKGAIAQAEAEMQQIANALSAYYVEYGRYPPGEGSITNNVEYEHEYRGGQKPYFRDTWLPEHGSPDLPGAFVRGGGNEFFPDILIPKGKSMRGWPYENLTRPTDPARTEPWGLGCRYGLIAHLWMREQEGQSRWEERWYDRDTARDKAAKERWAVMLSGIRLTPGFSDLYNHVAGSGGWFNRVLSLRDPWDRNYRYRCMPPYLAYELWSVGPLWSDDPDEDFPADDIRVRD